MFELVNLDFYIHWWWAVWALGRLNTSSYREYGTCVMELQRSRPLRVIGNFTLKLRIFFLFAHFYEGRVQGKWRTFCWDINCLIPHKWLLFYQYFTYEQNFDENIAAATLPMQLPTTGHFCLPETSNLLFKSYSLFAKFKHKGCKYFWNKSNVKLWLWPEREF